MLPNELQMAIEIVVYIHFNQANSIGEVGRVHSAGFYRYFVAPMGVVSAGGDYQPPRQIQNRMQIPADKIKKSASSRPGATHFCRSALHLKEREGRPVRPPLPFWRQALQSNGVRAQGLEVESDLSRSTAQSSWVGRSRRSGSAGSQPQSRWRWTASRWGRCSAGEG